MKTKIQIKLVAATAFFLFFGGDRGQMQLGAEITVNDIFLYQPAAADYQGTWRTTGNRDLRIVLSGVLDTNIEMGGLSAQALRKIVGSSKKGFEIRRDAGTFLFEGCISNSRSGSGRFYFHPDTGYAVKMNHLLSSGSSKDNVTPDSSLFYCAVHNLTVDYAARIRDAGLKIISINDLLVLCSTGVAPEYAKTMIGIGYRDISPDDLILLTVQKVPTDFIKKIIGTSDNLPTVRELTLIWMYGDKVSDFKHHKN
ncbi:MAG TPA: hypothetical protein VMZ49_01965 [Patescibacteria group bacterium]|nr:hypothetical protein [Patescibacteria group bacterium]